MRRVRSEAARDPKVALLRWVQRRSSRNRAEQVIATLPLLRDERVLCRCGRKLNAALFSEPYMADGALYCEPDPARRGDRYEVTCDRCGQPWSIAVDDLYRALQQAWFKEPRDGAVRLPLDG